MMRAGVAYLGMLGIRIILQPLKKKQLFGNTLPVV